MPFSYPSSYDSAAPSRRYESYAAPGSSYHASTYSKVEDSPSRYQPESSRPSYRHEEFSPSTRYPSYENPQYRPAQAGMKFSGEARAPGSAYYPSSYKEAEARPYSYGYHPESSGSAYNNETSARSSSYHAPSYKTEQAPLPESYSYKAPSRPLFSNSPPRAPGSAYYPASYDQVAEKPYGDAVAPPTGSFASYSKPTKPDYGVETFNPLPGSRYTRRPSPAAPGSRDYESESRPYGEYDAKYSRNSVYHN